VATVVDAAAPKIAAVEAGAVETPDVLISDPARMNALDADGHDFVALLGGPARYDELAKVIEADVAEAKRVDPASGVGLAFGHRLLDTSLLHDKTARWEMIGVSARFDRAFADPSHCGELRFIYRLRYDKTVGKLAIASRMPATAAISFWHECDDKSWPQIPAPSALKFKSVELDVQTVRWPSTIRGDMAGHAEYALRALVKNKDRLEPGPLENTPDVERLRRDPALRKDLLDFIAANASKVDEGTVILPDRFLAKRATDVTPHGLARRHNRPFRDLFPELAEKNARRLDGMSCPGCHASRSIAGFHFLGDETAPAGSVNALFVARSPHLLDELARRKAKLGGAVTSIPFADRTSTAGERGAHCTLGKDPAFASWTCGAGLGCARDVGSDEDGIGVCAKAAPGVGDPCEIGHMSLSSDPHKDRVLKMESAACTCDDNKVGFPDGMCTAACGGAEMCGAIPQLVGFNACIAKSVSFEDCIKQNSTAAAVMSCDETHPCRDDYICARSASGAGACMPPYFLFQLRVDGHP
jgi:hypothetical protein